MKTQKKQKIRTLGNYRPVTKEEALANPRLKEGAMVRNFGPGATLTDSKGDAYLVNANGAFERAQPKPMTKRRARVMMQRERKELNIKNNS